MTQAEIETWPDPQPSNRSAETCGATPEGCRSGRRDAGAQRAACARGSPLGPSLNGSSTRSSAPQSRHSVLYRLRLIIAEVRWPCRVLKTGRQQLQHLRDAVIVHHGTRFRPGFAFIAAGHGTSVRIGNEKLSRNELREILESASKNPVLLTRRGRVAYYLFNGEVWSDECRRSPRQVLAHLGRRSTPLTNST